MADIKVPELAESITEGTIAEWLKNVGDQVTKGEDVVELETDKVNVQISAEDEGVLQEIKRQEGDTVEVGEIIAVLGSGSGAAANTDNDSAATEQGSQKQDDSGSAADESPQPAASESNDDSGRTVASPAARKMAREQGIDLSAVQSKDPLGRVRPEDVKAHSEQPKQSSSQTASGSQSQKQPAEQSDSKPVERVKMSRRRQTIANRLVAAQHNAAMLTTFNEVDMTNIMELRKRRKDTFLEKHDVKLGFMSFFTKAVVGALKAFPNLNAEIQGDELLLKKYYDIGIAVSAKEGLVVPVVRDADKRDFAGIEKEIGDLGTKARDNKLTLKELQGGSFTITNGGVFGSLWSTPILNAPQVGILGMHTIKTRPVAIDNERMENRPMMYIALSYDHRIVDGSEAVSFLAKVKELVEDPETLLLEG
ncbi:2-oxoglutarate dehydrogenase complex dihydrolipoyllysine-residue succinyltransferase [Tuberibacillus sp. Marseille-P3662]|uniref:2-oxoglutarate dehydrogenase complex dihydrolipoyllysine-residue succinyltransferase n=1 Tax=Tuberibacillus sp. Marseille-P3662 TaxID=1965358 RepID=UPI000A1CE274|nr:2-oxoglutarate dehydrogenase complex dihydrolipoyllysine-residue succinyltransferase [Tuberibacillus sp. Marseille-P3662]